MSHKAITKIQRENGHTSVLINVGVNKLGITTGIFDAKIGQNNYNKVGHMSFHKAHNNADVTQENLKAVCETDPLVEIIFQKYTDVIIMRDMLNTLIDSMENQK